MLILQEADSYCLVEYRLGHLASALRGNQRGLAPILISRFQPLFRPVVFYHRRNLYPAIQRAHGPASPFVKISRDAALMWVNIASNLGFDSTLVDTTTAASRYRPCARLGCGVSESEGVEFGACGGCKIFCALFVCLDGQLMASDLCSSVCQAQSWRHDDHKVACPLLRQPKHLR